MKYHIPAGTTIFLCYRPANESRKSIDRFMNDFTAPDPWTAFKTTRAVTYTDADRKGNQIADKTLNYEFVLPVNEKGATFFSVYKKDVTQF